MQIRRFRRMIIAVRILTYQYNSYIIWFDYILHRGGVK